MNYLYSSETPHISGSNEYRVPAIYVFSKSKKFIKLFRRIISIFAAIKFALYIT